jgi:hypothetical protein
MKKLLLLMTTIMLWSTASFAQPAQIGDSDVYWELTGGTLTISGTGEMPNLVNTQQPWYNDRALVITVVIQDGVTRIGDNAFRMCNNLTSVTIPNSVTSLGTALFHSCTSLTNATIPSSVTTLGTAVAGLFQGCTSLQYVTFLGNINMIPGMAFYNCSQLRYVNIPNSVTEIGSSAFWGCTGLTSITIPSSVASIANSAFEGCTNLRQVTIQQGAGTSAAMGIGNQAFRNCSTLMSIVIPGSVARIGMNAFNNCVGLTSLTIEEGVGTIEDDAFNGCSGLTSVAFPSTVHTFGQRVLAGCTKLTSITSLVSQPPTTSNFFQNITLANVTAYVRGSAWAAYNAATGWSAMAARLVRYFDVTTDVNDSAYGEVTRGGIFYQNTDVTVTATAKAGHVFINWTKADVEVSTKNVYTFNIGTADADLVANFAPFFSVELIADEGSTLGSGVYAKNTSLTIRAFPNEGYRFVNWVKIVDVTNAFDEVIGTEEVEVSTANPYTFTVTEEVELIAKFEALEAYHTVSLSATNGSVVGAGDYEEDTDATVGAIANTGYEFVNWTKAGAPVSTNNPYTFSVTEPVTLVANFTAIIPDTVTIRDTVTITIRDTVTITIRDTVTITIRDTVTITIRDTVTLTHSVSLTVDHADFLNWTKGGNVVSAANPYVFDVTEDVALVANFSSESGVTPFLPQTSRVDIYPNPSRGLVNIEVGGAIIEKITIYNTAGHVVHSRVNINNSSYSFDTGQFTSGFYSVSVQTKSGSIVSSKFIVN